MYLMGSGQRTLPCLVFPCISLSDKARCHVRVLLTSWQRTLSLARSALLSCELSLSVISVRMLVIATVSKNLHRDRLIAWRIDPSAKCFNIPY